MLSNQVLLETIAPDCLSSKNRACFLFFTGARGTSRKLLMFVTHRKKLHTEANPQHRERATVQYFRFSGTPNFLVSCSPVCVLPAPLFEDVRLSTRRQGESFFRQLYRPYDSHVFTFPGMQRALNDSLDLGISCDFCRPPIPEERSALPCH